MRVHVCRHGEAAPGEPDELRPLTARGADQADALGARLAQEAARPVAVLTSPLLRARQTAERIGARLGVEPLVDSRLAPGATLIGLRDALCGLDGPVATVGHQPDCSGIVVALTGSDPGFDVGSAVEVEIEPGR